MGMLRRKGILPDPPPARTASKPLTPGQSVTLATKLSDQVVLAGVGQGIDHLVEDVGGVDQAQDAGPFGGPEVLPAAAKGIHALGQGLVEVLEEVGIENPNFPTSSS